MIKPGWTHVLTLHNGDKRVVLINRLESGCPRDTAHGEYLVAPPYTHASARTVGPEYVFKVNPDSWEPVCEGRHSNPEELLTDPEPVELSVGTVRIGKSTGTRYEVRGIDGQNVWVLNGDTVQRDTWHRETFLRVTAPAPTFFEEGHDYEKRVAAGGVIRVTVRRVGQMPNGAEYAVAERRNGGSAGEPVLLAAYDFSTYGDVTK